LKNCLTQNKEIFQVIYDVKNEQKEFYKKTREQLNELLEKVDQLMIPENSYWKNLASKTCKIQLPILGIYSDGIAFQKAFEAMLEQEKPGYIEKHGPQWMHIYEGRIKPL
ncbi:334_t:CDS:2, partial [Rhizophagus irregularis]